MMQHEYSWCTMGTHDASWVLMMHHEYSWCIMSTHDASWALMMHHEYSWRIMSTHDASCVLMMHHEYSWCIMRTFQRGPWCSSIMHAYNQKIAFWNSSPDSPDPLDRVPQPPLGTSLPHAPGVRMTWVQNKPYQIMLFLRLSYHSHVTPFQWIYWLACYSAWELPVRVSWEWVSEWMVHHITKIGREDSWGTSRFVHWTTRIADHWVTHFEGILLACCGRVMQLVFRITGVRSHGRFGDPGPPQGNLGPKGVPSTRDPGEALGQGIQGSPWDPGSNGVPGLIL